MTTASEYARILTELHSQFLHEFANWQHHQYFVKKYEKELEDLKNTDPELLSPLDKINLQCSPQWIKREETSRDHCREKMNSLQQACQAIMNLLPPDEEIEKESEDEDEPNRFLPRTPNDSNSKNFYPEDK